VRADAPHGYWRLGELSGTAILEDQARANGTYSGGVVLGVAPAVSGSNTAARFDGGNDKGSVPDNSSLDFGTGDFTVEAWIKTLDSGERAIVAKRSLTASEPYWALTVTDDSHHNGQIRAAFSDGTTARLAYSTVGVLDGAWHHVVAWYDRDSGITISVDGVTTFTAMAIAADVSNTGTVEIGKAPTHNYFRGDLDEVALYGGLVSPERIAAHRAAAA
jgi:Concanavalin A-like lectin/glucanases superfamily